MESRRLWEAVCKGLEEQLIQLEHQIAFLEQLTVLFSQQEYEIEVVMAFPLKFQQNRIREHRLLAAMFRNVNEMFENDYSKLGTIYKNE